jgi:uncharacterized protein (DUF488 family)
MRALKLRAIRRNAFGQDRIPSLDQMIGGSIVPGRLLKRNMSNKKGSKIWTVGHSTRTLVEFLELLESNEIEALADVRRYPGSLRYPHFKEANLAASLADGGIEYAPFKQLGGRRRPKPDSSNTVWRSESFRGYADYMETSEFKVAMVYLLGLARRKRTAIMCSEAVWWRCHRALVSDYLKAAGITVEHIISLKKKEIHPFTSAARLLDGKLFYGAEQESSKFFARRHA